LSKNWEDGLRAGEYKNPGSMKKKKRGKPPQRPRELKDGIHKVRMAKRRTGG